MGRGQAISMVYDIAEDRLAGTVVVESGKFRLCNFNLNGELGFEIYDVDAVTNGTCWTIVSEKPQSLM